MDSIVDKIKKIDRFQDSFRFEVLISRLKDIDIERLNLLVKSVDIPTNKNNDIFSIEFYELENLIIKKFINYIKDNMFVLDVIISDLDKEGNPLIVYRIKDVVYHQHYTSKRDSGNEIDWKKNTVTYTVYFRFKQMEEDIKVV